VTSVRRTAVDRRAQLVEIGLELLPTTPVQDLTIDEVARRAGISRSLLFHYFASKREYYTAVIQAAAELLRDHVVPRPGTPRAGQLPGMLDRFVSWVETYRESYVAFVRGANAGDPWVAGVYEDTREELVEITLAAVPLPDGTRQRQLVRSWFAFTEDLVLQWTRDPTMTRAELLDLIAAVLDGLTVRAEEPAHVAGTPRSGAAMSPVAGAPPTNP
jgi:AcrR family transcriptional regulator